MEKKLDLKLVIMGIQHTFVMFGATVLVPLLTGLDIGVTLFAAGIGTIIFHILTKFKVPVFLGSSFAFQLFQPREANSTQHVADHFG